MITKPTYSPGLIASGDAVKSTIIILAACLLAVPLALLIVAVVPFAIAGASYALIERAEDRRTNARQAARINQLCEALAARAPAASWCEGTAERMNRMFN